MKKPSNEAKTKKVSHKKKTYTYAEAHNRAFWAFNKAAKVMVWAAVFNVIGLMIAILQETFATQNQPLFRFVEESYLYYTVSMSSYQYSLCYSTCSFFFRLLEIPSSGRFGPATLPIYGFIIIIVVIAILFSAATVWLSVNAAQGKKWALFTQTGFYLFDTTMIIANIMIGEATELIWIMFALHAIILFFIGVSIYQYYHIFKIEEIYKNDQNHFSNEGDKSNSSKDETEPIINMMAPNPSKGEKNGKATNDKQK